MINLSSPDPVKAPRPCITTLDSGGKAATKISETSGLPEDKEWQG
jgi:hypothetical protein